MVIIEDLVIDMDPDNISALKDVEKVLQKLRKYEKEYLCKAGIALKQNMQFGGSYKVVSEEQFKTGKASACEYYIHFWPKQYFEDLKEQLK